MPPSNSPRPPLRGQSYRDNNLYVDEPEETGEIALAQIFNKLQVDAGETTSVNDLTRAMHKIGIGGDDKQMEFLAQLILKVAVSADESTSNNTASPTSSDRSGLSKENSEPPPKAAASQSSSRNSRTSKIFARSRSRSHTPKRETATAETPQPPKSRTPLRSQSPLLSLLRRASKGNGDASASAASSKPTPPPPAPRPTPVAEGAEVPVNTPHHTTAFPEFLSPPSTLGGDSLADTPFTMTDSNNDLDVSITTPMLDTQAEEAVKTGDFKKRNKATTTPTVPYFGQGDKVTPPLPVYNPVTSPLFSVDLSKNKNKKAKAGVGTRLKRATRKEAPAFVPVQPFVAATQQPFVATAQPLHSFGAPSAQPLHSFGAPPAQPNFGAAAPTPHFGVASSFSFDNASPVQTFGAPAAAASYPQEQAFQQNTPYNVQQATVPTTSFKSPMSGLTFTLGTVSPTHKSSRRRTGASTNPRRRGRPEQTRTPPQPSFSPTVAPSASQDSSSYAESAAADTASADSSSARNVDYSGHKARIEAYRVEARDHYTNSNYKLSVIAYTNALSTYTREAYVAQQGGPDDHRAILLANRAAALLMLGAYEASVYDCNEASSYTSKLTANANGEFNFSTEGGPILQAKALTRMGRALIKLGKLVEARKAFDLALNIVRMASGVIPTFNQTNPDLVQLNSVQIDATSGMTEINRCQESVDVIKSCGLTSPKDAESASRRVNLRALSNINSALVLAPGSIDLFEMKLAVLGALNRWREVFMCCERFAADRVKFDGVFTQDLEGRNSLRRVPEAIYLKATMFDGEDGTKVKLTSKAIAEATIRLPTSIQPVYIRSLRLEERCHPALFAINALAEFLDTYLPRMERVNYAWLTREKGKLERTNRSKEMGDTLFRTSNYKQAVDQYTACLLIDSEDQSGKSEDVGGRLNAVLHCNRAAAYMALSKYREAISDCSAALHIHSHYMKAMLRRSRCYARLNRFEEAQAEFLRYINLVETARAEFVSTGYHSYHNAPCIFDGPKDISAGDLETVRQELNELRRAKINSEHAKRAEEAERLNRQKRYQESFGQSEASDAEQRRQQWYNQQDNNSSRRWDSFSGRGPHRGPHPGANTNHSYKQSSSNRGSYRARPEPERQQSGRNQNSGREERKPNPTAASSPVSDTTSCHYKVLNVSRNATGPEIKKGYRKAALKYHPDKNMDANAPDMFRRVSLAYEVLKDPVQKHSYDQEIRWSRR